MAQLTEREQQAIALLEEQRALVRAKLTELQGKVQDYLAQFDNATNEEVIAEARKDARFSRDVLFHLLPLQPTASDCLRALEHWAERDLNAEAVRVHLRRLEKAIKALTEDEEWVPHT